MRYVISFWLLAVVLMGIPHTAQAETNPIVVHENVIVDEAVELYEGFRSPNEMVFIFVLIVLLSVIGLGIINAIE
ncbi:MULTISPECIES: hypothetical protein [unclassified Exiguobacterium]|uniref:hypothetical protein n=2 Tax=Bacillales Family XII. Incertae Sedis TaxID=539742 RepID=UPI0005148976|nr:MULTISPECIES: hypothetical protein [unclassified Exiguobacterium]KGI84248.1 hypothetical protein JY98_13470 [Exiguobacterium mexicanum]